MANITARLYIRSAAGYCTPPQKLLDPPPGQTYYLVWFEGARKRIRSVGNFSDAAQVALINKQSELRKAAINPQAQGQRNTPQSDAPVKPQLADAATEYLNRVKKSKKHKTFLAYNLAVMDFLAVVGDKPTGDLTRKDILKFMDWMRDKGVDDRTIHNRLSYCQRENPRLCRGGSSSLTFPGVHPETLQREPPSTRRGETGWTNMQA